MYPTPIYRVLPHSHLSCYLTSHLLCATPLPIYYVLSNFPIIMYYPAPIYYVLSSLPFMMYYPAPIYYVFPRSHLLCATTTPIYYVLFHSYLLCAIPLPFIMDYPTPICCVSCLLFTFLCASFQ